MVILFDVNGTLLNTAALQKPLRAALGSKWSVGHFLSRLLQSAMANTLAGSYRTFSELAADELEVNASSQGKKLSTKKISEVIKRLRHLPPFPDVKPTLERLQEAGFRMATLTNSNQDMLEEQLRYAGLTKYFEKTLSIESVRKYKPAAETYQYAADSLGVDTGRLLMVAAHPWDLLGAAAAGCVTAFVMRPGQALPPGARVPAYIANDLINLADQLQQISTGPVMGPRKVAPDHYALMGTCVLALGMASVLVPALTSGESGYSR
jgi:2-haloacid dehalogenase